MDECQPNHGSCLKARWGGSFMARIDVYADCLY